MPSSRRSSTTISSNSRRRSGAKRLCSDRSSCSACTCQIDVKSMSRRLSAASRTWWAWAARAARVDMCVLVVVCGVVVCCGDRSPAPAWHAPPAQLTQRRTRHITHWNHTRIDVWYRSWLGGGAEESIDGTQVGRREDDAPRVAHPLARRTHFLVSLHEQTLLCKLIDGCGVGAPC